MEIDIHEITKILSTPIALRSVKMIQVLMTLTKEISFFKQLITELGEKMHYRICEFLNVECTEAEQVLFNEGDQGDRFYILLEGKVKLITLRRSSGGDTLMEIAQLGPGQSFGELSLIKNRPRTATVVCMQSCYLMTLSKENYLRLLGKSAAKMLEDKIEFLHSLKMFNKCTKRYLEKISFFFEPRSFKNNEIIYNAGENSIGTFVIIQGEVELTTFNTTEKDLPKKLKVALIGAQDFFGDEEVLKELPRKYTARCSSKVLSTYFISKADFLERIDKESLKCLVRANIIRNAVRETRLKSVEKLIKARKQSLTPEVPVKKGIKIALTGMMRKGLVSKSASRNLCLNKSVMKNIRKRSLFSVNSPTATILSNCSISKRPKSSHVFFNTNGFQPRRLPSGIFQKIQNRIKLIM